MSTLALTIRESLRYRGRSGHWSWLAHRVSGLGILGFLVIHVWDTANATFYPPLYEWSIELFKHPLFAMGEVALMAAVLYHAFNGIRITIMDFKPSLWKYQGKSAVIVWGLFFIIFIPIAILMLNHVVHGCQARGDACWQIPSPSDPQFFD